ncbi:MAG: PKD domain-containing protein [Thermoplasmatota archaeon]
MRGLALAFLFIFLSLGGCLQSDSAPAPEAVEDTTDEPESDADPEPVTFDWFPLEPVAGETILLEAPQGATQVVWLVGTQRHEGHTLRIDLPAGSHEVSVRFHNGTGFQTLAAVIEVAPAPAGPEPPAEPPQDDSSPVIAPHPDPVIEWTQQRNQAAFSFDWNAAPARVDWFFGDGATSNEIEPSHDYGAPGTYTVRAVVWLAESRYTPDPVRIVVEDVPLDFTIDRNGASIEVTARWDHDDADFAWDFGDGGIGSGREAAHVYTDAGPHTITVQAVAGGDAEVASQTILLDDFPLTVEAELDANVATFSAVWGFDANYTWYFGDGQRSNDETPTHRYPGIGTYTVTVQARAGQHVAAHTFEIEVTETKLGITATVDINRLAATATWDLPADNYTWDLDSHAAYGAVIEHVYDAVGPRILVLTATSGPHVERVQIPITIWTMPVIPTVTVPPGNVATFGYTWSHVPDVVRWDFGDGQRANGPTPVHTYEDGIGTYTAKVTVSNPDLRAVGIQEVVGTIDVEILLDGIPQFRCGGEPVYEPHLNKGSDGGLRWAAFKTGFRPAVTWTTDTPQAASIDILEDGKWVTYTENNTYTQHLFVMSGLSVGSDFCFRLDGETHAMRLVNGMNDLDDGVYGYNLMMGLVAGASEASVRGGLDRYADLMYDATDGWIRAEETWVFQGWPRYQEAAGTPVGDQPPACEDPTAPRGTFGAGTCSIFDTVIVGSTPGAGGYATLNGVQTEDGRVVNDGSYLFDEDTSGDAREFGAVLVHELGHYLMGMSDKYVALGLLPYPPIPVYTCPGESQDGISVMGGSRDATEFDGTENPCPDDEWSTGGLPVVGGRGPPAPYTPSWTEMTQNFPAIPAARPGGYDPGPDGNGDQFEYRIFDMSGAA